MREALDIKGNTDFEPFSLNFPQIVKGSNFDMGYQQGKMNAFRILNWLNIVFAEDSLGFFKYLEWPMRLAAPIMHQALSAYWKRYLRRYLPGTLERIEGLAKGAGCSVGEILYQQAIEILGAFPLHTGGCSSLLVSSQLFERGEQILAKNFDYMPFLKGFQIIRESYPEKGYASLDLTIAPIAGSHAGLNECGLIVIYHYAYSRDEKQHGLPLSLFVQHFLQTCSTVEEVLEKVGRIPWLASGMLILSDAKDRFALVEFSNSHMSKRRISNPWVAVTNHLTDPNMKEYAMSPKAKFPEFLPLPWKGTRIRENSEMRLHDLDAFMQKRKKVTLFDVQKIFADHGINNEGSNNTVCRHSKISSTISSAILFPSSLSLLYCHGAPCSGTYQAFQLKNRNNI